MRKRCTAYIAQNIPRALHSMQVTSTALCNASILGSGIPHNATTSKFILFQENKTMQTMPVAFAACHWHCHSVYADSCDRLVFVGKHYHCLNLVYKIWIRQNDPPWISCKDNSFGSCGKSFLGRRKCFGVTIYAGKNSSSQKLSEVNFHDVEQAETCTVIHVQSTCITSTSSGHAVPVRIVQCSIQSVPLNFAHS